MAEYIDRDEVIAWIWKQKRLSKGYTVMVIQDLPAAAVAPVVHGRWKYNTDFYVWRCSECGENPHKGTGVVVSEENLPAYCPHCGAKMDLEDENHVGR